MMCLWQFSIYTTCHMTMISSAIVTPHDHHTNPQHHHRRNLNLRNIVDLPKYITPSCYITPPMLLISSTSRLYVHVLHSSHVNTCVLYYCQFRTCGYNAESIYGLCVHCSMYSKFIENHICFLCHVTIIITNADFIVFMHYLLKCNNDLRWTI